MEHWLLLASPTPHAVTILLSLPQAMRMGDKREIVSYGKVGKEHKN